MTVQRFQGRKNIYKYDDPGNEFFQVILPEFVLNKIQQGLEVNIEIKKDLFCIRSVNGKKEFFSAIRETKKNQRIIAEKLRDFKNDPHCLSYRFTDPEFYFRYANGGVLPVLRLKTGESGDREDYFCFFYREIFPVGWNIANGSSDNRDELFRPSDIILREFNEELIITDNTKKLRYVFDMDEESFTQQTHNLALKAWDQKTGKNISAYERLYIPIKWIDGPDSVSVKSGGQKVTAHGFFLSILPEDNSIELDKIGFVNLSGDISLLDGEIFNERLINGLIGLFRVDTFEEKLSGNEFLPDKIFFDGIEKDDRDIQALITTQFLPQLGNIISKKDRDAYHNTTHKFDLCPITRSITTQYFNWMKIQDQQATAINKDRESPAPLKTAVEHPGTACNIFLSYKSEDSEYAVKLYDYLISQGENVFFSGRSLQVLGESDYAKAIDKALDKADCMIVLGTAPEYLDSGWVSYEWKSFFNEIRSDRKKHGRIFTFTNNINIHNLPYALRNVQNIEFKPASIMNSFEMLMRYLKQGACGH